jgi:hypothetical protein
MSRRRQGFALTETLVAVGIGALIVTALVWLQVDYLSLARRAMTLGQVEPAVRGLRAQAKAFDTCGYPGLVLARSEQGVVALRPKDEPIPVIGLPGPGWSARSASAARLDGSSRPGWSAAAINRGDATIAVIALRCDLAEVCAYDVAKGECRGGQGG